MNKNLIVLFIFLFSFMNFMNIDAQTGSGLVYNCDEKTGIEFFDASIDITKLFDGKIEPIIEGKDKYEVDRLNTTKLNPHLDFSDTKISVLKYGIILDNNISCKTTDFLKWIFKLQKVGNSIYLVGIRLWTILALISLLILFFLGKIMYKIIFPH